MKKLKVDITEDSIRLKSLSPKDEKVYLDMQRRASLFANAFDHIEGLWEYMIPTFREHLTDKEIRCLIYDLQSGKAVGFVEATKSGNGHWEIGIAILPEDRKQGFGFRASHIFVKYLFENLGIDAVYWNVFPKNAPSIRIAEKLDGKCIGTGRILESWLRRAGFKMDGDLKAKTDETKNLIYKIEPGCMDCE